MVDKLRGGKVGIGRDGKEWVGMGRDGKGWKEMGREGMGRDGKGSSSNHCEVQGIFLV